MHLKLYVEATFLPTWITSFTKVLVRSVQTLSAVTINATGARFNTASFVRLTISKVSKAEAGKEALAAQLVADRRNVRQGWLADAA